MRKTISVFFLCALVQSVYPQWVSLSNDFTPNISVTAYDSTIIAGSSSFGSFDLAISNDCGNTWVGKNLASSGGVTYLSSKDTMVYACTANGIFVSRKDTLIWSSYNDGLPGGLIHKMLFKDSIQLAVSNSQIYQRIVGSSAWTTICESSPVIGISDFDFDGNLMVVAGNGIAESRDMGLSWTLWSDYIFEWNAVTIKGDTIIAASKGGIYRKITSSGSISDVSNGLIKLWNPSGYDYYGEFKMFHQIGDNIFLCGETGVYKLSQESWNWEHTGLNSLSYDLSDNGNLLYAVQGYGGIWSRLLNQLNVSVNEEPALQSSFYLFPNPAYDILNIQSVNNKRSANLQIFDINGNMKISKEMLQEQTIVNTGTLNPGVYIIRIEYDQKVVNYKLLIY